MRREFACKIETVDAFLMVSQAASYAIFILPFLWQKEVTDKSLKSEKVVY